MKRKHLIALVLLAFAPWLQAQESEPVEATDSVTEPAAEAPAQVARVTNRLELDATTVTGARELPQVMVIVPWKRPEIGAMGGRPLASLVEEVLTPIDPAVFRRELKYHRALTAGEQKSAATDKASAIDDNAEQ